MWLTTVSTVFTYLYFETAYLVLILSLNRGRSHINMVNTTQ